MIRAFFTSAWTVSSISTGVAPAAAESTESEIERVAEDAASAEQEPSSSELARQHFGIALEHVREENYRAALENFHAAQRLAPHHSVLFNIARVHEELYQLEEAIEFYSLYLAAAGDAVPKERQVQIERSLDRLRAAVGRRPVARSDDEATLPLVPVKVSCPYPDFQVVVQGAVQATSPVEGMLLVPGGAPTLTFVRPGYEADVHQIEVTSEGPLVQCWPQRRGQLENGAAGFLHLAVEPVGAAVRINGEDSEAKSPLLLPRGRHLVEVSAHGYMAQTLTVDVNARLVEQEVRLVPKVQPAEKGSPDATRMVLGATIGGVGVLLAGATIGLYSWNHARHNQWEEDRAALSGQSPGTPGLAGQRADSNAQLKSIQTMDAVTWATGIAGGIFVAAGAFIYFVDFDGGHHELAVSPSRILFTSRW